MIRAIYPGSFDPVSNGHLDIIRRAAEKVDELIVAILVNRNKSHSLFTVEERIEQLKLVTKDLPNVSIDCFQGLLVDFARQKDAQVIIRGLRAVTDFESEFQMALTNRSLSPNLETFFIPTSVEYLYLSSSTIKEVASFGGDICGMVPCEIKQALMDKYKK